MKYTIVCAVTDDEVELKDNSQEAYEEGLKELEETYCAYCEYKYRNTCPYDMTKEDK